MKVCGIYCLRNKLTDKVYVGSSLHTLKRGYGHYRALVRGSHPNEKLQRAWLKYGAHTFEFFILETCVPAMLLVCEQRWIDQLRAYVDGYNMTPIAGNTLGRKFSAASKAKIGAKSKERNQGIKHPMYGRQHSLETKAKMSADRRGKPIPALRGHKRSEETKQRLREHALARVGPNPFAGKTHSDATRAKMRAYWARRREMLGLVRSSP